MRPRGRGACSRPTSTSPAISPVFQGSGCGDAELAAVRLHRGCRLRGRGDLRHSLGRDRRRRDPGRRYRRSPPAPWSKAKARTAPTRAACSATSAWPGARAPVSARGSPRRTSPTWSRSLLRPPRVSATVERRTGGTSGAAILAQLCPGGSPGPGVVFEDSGCSRTSLTWLSTIQRTRAIRRCRIESFSGRGGGVLVPGRPRRSRLSRDHPASEVAACRAHLRVSCGQPEP